MTKTLPAVLLKQVGVSFGSKEALQNISWQIETGEIATLLGPNGCGKSTLLKAITGNLKASAGTIIIEGQPLSAYKGSELAQKVAFLPQSPELPRDMIVEELVYCGRFPHQSWWHNSAGEDRQAVEAALEATKTIHLKDRVVASLSGGERQRVWIAMALAQEPHLLILDEPTTYLDINHQLEIMELLQRLNEEQGLTVLMVLHEMNQAAHYSHRLAVMKEGRLVAEGAPAQIMTAELLQEVFAVQASVEREPAGTPYVRIEGLLKK